MKWIIDETDCNQNQSGKMTQKHFNLKIIKLRRNSQKTTPDLNQPKNSKKRRRIAQYSN